LTGSISNLTISKLIVSTLNDTYVNVSGNVKNAMDPEKLLIDLNIANLRTSNRDISRLVAKSMLPPDIEIPSSIQIRGKVKGGMNNFNTNMVLNSSAGDASLIANYIAGRDTSYLANINVQDFDIGCF